MFSAVESTDVNECNEPEDVTEDVKENWDDSEEEAEGEVEMKGEEEEVEASVVASPTGRSTHAVVAQEAAVADEGDSEVSEESENSSESEDETLPAPERQRVYMYPPYCEPCKCLGPCMHRSGAPMSRMGRPVGSHSKLVQRLYRRKLSEAKQGT